MTPPPEQHRPPAYGPPSGGTDGLIALIVGGIMLYLYPRFLQWLSHSLFGTAFSPFMLNGREVPYRQVPEFWLDLGVTVFAAAMVVEGLVLLSLRRVRAALFLAVGVTAVSVVLNLAVVIMQPGSGFPLVSAIAVLVGIWAGVQLLTRANALRHG